MRSEKRKDMYADRYHAGAKGQKHCHYAKHRKTNSIRRFVVIQRQRRIDGDLDIWEVEYTYRCILTNEYKLSARDIVEFYNLRIQP